MSDQRERGGSNRTVARIGCGPATLCLLAGLAGIALNARVGSASVSENVLGLLVFLSLVLMGIGFIPAMRSWPNARVANVTMSLATAMYAVWILTKIIGRH